MDMIDLFPFLTGNETYEAALRKYIAASKPKHGNCFAGIQSQGVKILRELC